MTTTDFVDSIPNFIKLSFSDQIQRFCWHLTVNSGKTSFTGTDVKRCFDESGCSVPSAISPFLGSLANQRTPIIRRKGSAYQLTRAGLEKFQSLMPERAATVTVDKTLRELPAQLPQENERVFLEEALICFRNKAYRAAIVMTWNLAYDHLCNVILSKHLAAFNAQLPKSYPKADILAIALKDDFELLKEHQVLQVCKSANIFSGSVHKVLKEKLDRRNIAAHPSSVSIASHTAEDVIIDLVNNAVLKIV